MEASIGCHQLHSSLQVDVNATAMDGDPEFAMEIYGLTRPNLRDGDIEYKNRLGNTKKAASHKSAAISLNIVILVFDDAA